MAFFETGDAGASFAEMVKKSAEEIATEGEGVIARSEYADIIAAARAQQEAAAKAAANITRNGDRGGL